jgi:hypothetical protein
MKLITILCFYALSANSYIETKVYICGAAGAKKYHYTESCRGLNACKHKIVKVTISQAKGYGLTLCGWED